MKCSKKIEKLKSSTFYVKSSGGGTSITIKAARLDQTDEEIADNIFAVLKFMRPILGYKVQSISFKSPDSISIPVYQNIVLPREEKVPVKIQTPWIARKSPLENTKNFNREAEKLRVIPKKEEKFDVLPKWRKKGSLNNNAINKTRKFRN